MHSTRRHATIQRGYSIQYSPARVPFLRAQFVQYFLVATISLYIYACVSFHELGSYSDTSTVVPFQPTVLSGHRSMIFNPEGGVLPPSPVAAGHATCPVLVNASPPVAYHPAVTFLANPLPSGQNKYSDPHSLSFALVEP